MRYVTISLPASEGLRSESCKAHTVFKLIAILDLISPSLCISEKADIFEI